MKPLKISGKRQLAEKWMRTLTAKSPLPFVLFSVESVF